MSDNNIEDWVTTQMVPSKNVHIMPKVVVRDPALSPAEQNLRNYEQMLSAPMSPMWLLQELRAVNGLPTLTPYMTRIIASHIVDGRLVPIDPTTHRVWEH
jgi:hypothetical protein